jgi:hypothetical protein
MYSSYTVYNHHTLYSHTVLVVVGQVTAEFDDEALLKKAFLEKQLRGENGMLVAQDMQLGEAAKAVKAVV